MPCISRMAQQAAIANGEYFFCNSILYSDGSMMFPRKSFKALCTDAKTVWLLILESVTVFLGFTPQLIIGVPLFLNNLNAVSLVPSHIPVIPSGKVCFVNRLPSSNRTAIPDLMLSSVCLYTLTTVNFPLPEHTVLSEI